MKKVLSVLLSMFLLAALAGLASAASAGDVTLYVDCAQTDAVAGDTIEVTVSVVSSVPIKALGFELAYDSQAMEILDGRWEMQGVIASPWSSEDPFMVTSLPRAMTFSEKTSVFTYYVFVTDEAQDDDYTFSLSSASAEGSDYVSVVGGKVSVNPISVEFVMENVTVHAGDEFAVNIRTKDGEYVLIKSVWIGDPVYDAGNFELLGGQWAEGLNYDRTEFEANNPSAVLIQNWDGESGVLVFNGDSVTHTGNIFSLRFKAGSTGGDYSVDCSIVLHYINRAGRERTANVTVTPADVTVETYIRGDVNGDGEVTSDDAIYLLRHTLNPNRYPLNQPGDMNGDNAVTSDDAIYLLRHTLNPNRYPLH